MEKIIYKLELFSGEKFFFTNYEEIENILKQIGSGQTEIFIKKVGLINRKSISNFTEDYDAEKRFKSIENFVGEKLPENLPSSEINKALKSPMPKCEWCAKRDALYKVAGTYWCGSCDTDRWFGNEIEKSKDKNINRIGRGFENLTNYLEDKKKDLLK